jgi:hypothetical protein
VFYSSPLWQFYRIVAHNAEHFSALLPTCSTLLPTTMIIFPHCRQQRRKCSNSGPCMFIRAVAHNAGYFSALWTTVRKNDNEIHHRMVAVVYNNAEKSKNSNISTNLTPYANLHWGFNPVLMLTCFMKKSLGETSRGNVSLKRLSSEF